MGTRSPIAAVGAAIVLLLAAASVATPAQAARLAGGRQQAAIHRAFTASAAHRSQVIVSIRTSTVAPEWAIVRSVTPERGGRTSGHGATPRLLGTFYHRVGGAERPGAPPAAVQADLTRTFRVAVVYAGSGSESIAYAQLYRSVCAGAGGFTDQQSVTVAPMSWSVRFVVNLDTLLAAVRTAQGAMLVPNVTFDARGSHLSAVENLSRTAVDAGCNGKPTTSTCRSAFHLGGSDPSGRISFLPGSGTEVGLPMAARSSGTCDPADYTLGPSLWDSGGGTALAGTLGLLGGSLPANPYAPIRVSWPGGSAQDKLGFAASPCQGDTSACSDDFHWNGTVTLAPMPGG